MYIKSNTQPVIGCVFDLEKKPGTPRSLTKLWYPSKQICDRFIFILRCGAMPQVGAISDKKANEFIEVLRIIAAFGIVAYHGKAPFHDFTYSGLIIFLILSPYVDCDYNWGRKRSVLDIAKKLLIPWALWMIIYGVLNLVMRKPLLPVPNPIAGILYGTSAHLWFIPAIFAVLVFLNAVKKKIDAGLLFWVCVCLTVVLLLASPIWRPISMGWTPPFAQWAHGATAVFMGIALGLYKKMPQRQAFVARIMIFLTLIYVFLKFIPGISVSYLVGAALPIVAVVSWSYWGPVRWSVRALSACMLGVYFSHILFLYVFSRLTGPGNYVTVTLAFVAAALVTWVAQRFIPYAQLAFGPKVVYAPSRARSGEYR
ncbi:acyltransferase [Xanthobacter autotrophicus]|uniref:acyltransferase n=1 Tax=Xanthobacter autotrophicus TaxID=280 RepID=UPI0024A68610|nr:acyltransferase [Xanthobacter autotrophicus]MDI4657194.1 acyltransferase [Xanthobacter autotrophicus]